MYDFSEYGEMLGAYYFQAISTALLGSNVPVNQRRVGVLKVEDNTHPSTRMFASSWPIAEEFYTFASAPWSESAPELNISSPGNFKAPMGFHANGCTCCSASIPSIRAWKVCRRVRAFRRADLTGGIRWALALEN